MASLHMIAAELHEAALEQFWMASMLLLPWDTEVQQRFSEG